MTLDDGRLIDLVQSYSYLYDRKRSDFKDAKKKDLAWAEIGKLLGYTDEECKRRWLYLREKYVKEKNGKSSGSEAVKQWDFFNSLRWLDMHIMKRKTKSNCSKEMQETTSQESQSQDTIEICQEDFSINGEAEEEPIGSRSPVFLNEILIWSPSSSRPSTPSTSRSKKRKVNQGNGTLEILDSLQNMGNTVTNMATRILNTKKVED
ncbi:hypothetical protein RN001_003015 [Aquatica leii]|uniref:MADF domain-containing protein n=1 Tax=Aquatica leii TaxID=1421715 RepID=A0AAN7Q5V6_9COLE|nr:hypothetical protein RN001_003015 [Aquatica leii]